MKEGGGGEHVTEQEQDVEIENNMDEKGGLDSDPCLDR